MKVLITGGAGFIGSEISAHLLNAGHQVTLATHHAGKAQRRFPATKVIFCDFKQDLTPEIWLQRLDSMDAVINCVGILEAGCKKTMNAIHYQAPKALFEACQTRKIHHLIHISAIGLEQSPKLDYAISKKKLEDHLLQEGPATLILRPSWVYGDKTYGGSSLFRALSAFPGLIPLPGNGLQQFQPIHISDLAAYISDHLSDIRFKTEIMHAVGPETLSLKTILIKSRAWLGFKPAPTLSIPLCFLKCLTPLGQIFPWFPIKKTSLAMIQNQDLAISKQPPLPQTKSFSKHLDLQPSATQDRWQARLFFMHPLLRIILAFLWLSSGMISLVSGQDALNLLAAAHIPSSLQMSMLILGAVLDVLLGLWVLSGRHTKWANLSQILIIIFYTLFLSIMLPQLWLDPFGALTKNIPILALILTLIIIEEPA
ncbi:MAG: SDR family oxidoreductase [Gammaproteobacteria bacterium]|nr:SDR family oxidoreductase [Gammaproteobacteria bacterium]